jgi:hypothetical protein
MCNTCPKSEYYSQGYLGKDKYIVPLHVLSVVAGHTTRRIAISNTETSVYHIEVLVSCNVTESQAIKLPGSSFMPKCLKIIMNRMDNNEFCPYQPRVELLTNYNSNKVDCPLVLGNKFSSLSLSNVDIACI